MNDLDQDAAYLRDCAAFIERGVSKAAYLAALARILDRLERLEVACGSLDTHEALAARITELEGTLRELEAAAEGN